MLLQILSKRYFKLQFYYKWLYVCIKKTPQYRSRWWETKGKKKTNLWFLSLHTFFLGSTSLLPSEPLYQLPCSGLNGEQGLCSVHKSSSLLLLPVHTFLLLQHGSFLFLLQWELSMGHSSFREHLLAPVGGHLLQHLDHLLSLLLSLHCSKGCFLHFSSLLTD